MAKAENILINLLLTDILLNLYTVSTGHRFILASNSGGRSMYTNSLIHKFVPVPSFGCNKILPARVKTAVIKNMILAWVIVGDCFLTIKPSCVFTA